jgi:hypothetical protein
MADGLMMFIMTDYYLAKIRGYETEKLMPNMTGFQAAKAVLF